MRIADDHPSAWAVFPLVFVVVASGCSQSEYRLQADREAYSTISERNGDPRWAATDLGIDLDPRSRYFDAYDPDHSPMPNDDPASHEYMHLVNGEEGWEHWHENGERVELENPDWRQMLGDYVEVNDDGAVTLDVDSALSLAYVHAPTHQRQLETLYLSALDVSEERFRLDTQFFGGNDILYNHNGKLVPAGLAFDPAVGKFAVFPPRGGLENNRLSLESDLRARRRFATAGELLVGFANSFVFEFTGGDANLTSSLANFSFIQPLLRGAGRDIALEQLTLDERRLLANLRAYGQFRQGFYTQISIGELGVTGPQRGVSSTSLQSFSGSGFVGGYLGLLQQAQQIRNTEDNLNLQLRTRDRLEALYDNELIGLVQVDQFRQGIEETRADLLDRTNSLKLALDNYKTGTLGLPSDLPVNLDESLIQQFQLFPRAADPILKSLFELQIRVRDVGELVDLDARTGTLQTRLGGLLADIDVEAVDRTLGDFLSLAEAIDRRLDSLPDDLTRLDAMDDAAAAELTDTEKALVQLIRNKQAEGPDTLSLFLAKGKIRLQRLSDDLTAENREATVAENLNWLKELLRLSQACVLVQSRARDLDSEPKAVLKQSLEFIEPVRKLFDGARRDLARMDETVPVRESMMNQEEKELFRRDRQRLHQRLVDLEAGEVGFDVSVLKLQSLQDEMANAPKAKTLRGLTAWVQAFLQVVGRLSLVPAQARLEVINLEAVDLESEEAFQVALTHRLDFMNGRAALVDRWRAIQVNADALQSVLNVTASGDVRTAKNNPVSFRAPTANLRLGLEFDAPFTRLLERNDYRESLITYQQSRRDFIQSRDSLQKGLRALIRTLEQRRRQLEIQRRAVAIAMRRVDQTQLDLNTPPADAQLGARIQISPTTAINLLSAQRSLQTTQNSFLAAWLRYYAARLRLYRELGIMELDPEGRWIPNPLDFGEGVPSEDDELEVPLPLPPMIPAAVIEAATRRQTAAQASSVARSSGTATGTSVEDAELTVAVPSISSPSLRPAMATAPPIRQTSGEIQHSSAKAAQSATAAQSAGHTEPAVRPALNVRREASQTGSNGWRPVRMQPESEKKRSRGWVATKPDKIAN
jgi:outer membrane protein TolC